MLIFETHFDSYFYDSYFDSYFYLHHILQVKVVSVFF